MKMGVGEKVEEEGEGRIHSQQHKPHLLLLSRCPCLCLVHTGGSKWTTLHVHFLVECTLASRDDGRSQRL